MGYVVPEVHGQFLNSLGRHYNRAMVNGELTGGYGHSTLYVLRDILHYPNLFRWRGKHDDMPGQASWKKAAWFETTQYTRTQLFELARMSLREAVVTKGDAGVTVRDDILAGQIRRCTRMETGRIEVRQGHDDVLFGFMLANIAMRQWAPPRNQNPSSSYDREQRAEAEATLRRMGYIVNYEAAEALGRHCAKVMAATERYPNESEYDYDPEEAIHGS